MSAPIRLAGAGSIISRLFTENTKGVWKGENKATTLFESKTKANKCVPRRLSVERERQTIQSPAEAPLGQLMTVKKFPEEQMHIFVYLFVCLQGKTKRKDC